jgi:hypothetical protein
VNDRSREQLLAALVAGVDPPDEIARELAAFPWDSDGELVRLTKRDAEAMLSRYLDAVVDERHVEAWADAIEGREDVGFDSDGPELLAEMVFELANPAITQPLTRELAGAWLERLTTAT